MFKKRERERPAGGEGSKQTKSFIAVSYPPVPLTRLLIKGGNVFLACLLLPELTSKMAEVRGASLGVSYMAKVQLSPSVPPQQPKPSCARDADSRKGWGASGKEERMDAPRVWRHLGSLATQTWRPLILSSWGWVAVEAALVAL